MQSGGMAGAGSVLSGCRPLIKGFFRQWDGAGVVLSSAFGAENKVCRP